METTNVSFRLLTNTLLTIKKIKFHRNNSKNYARLFVRFTCLQCYTVSSILGYITSVLINGTIFCSILTTYPKIAVNFPSELNS